MIEGTTTNGFKYTIDEASLDDWEIFEDLRAIDSGDTMRVFDVMPKMLGAEQFEALKNHVRDANGRVRMSVMVATLTEILGANKTTKK